MNSKNEPYVAILLAASLLLSFPTYTRSQQAVELLLGTPTIGLGSDSNRVVALKQRRVDAIMTAVPYDFLIEKDGFRRLVYVKDVVDLPLSGLATHDDPLRA